MRSFVRYFAPVLVALGLGASVAFAQTYNKQISSEILSVTAETASYTVQLSDANTLFTNTGASGAITLTLPPCRQNFLAGGNPPYEPIGPGTVGFHVHVLVDAAQTVYLQPYNPTSSVASSGDTIKVLTDGSTTSGADRISNATAKSEIDLVCAGDKVWYPASSNGTWADAN